MIGDDPPSPERRDFIRKSVLVGAGAAAAALAAPTILPMFREPGPAPAAIRTTDGSAAGNDPERDLLLADLDGPAPTMAWGHWGGEPAIVFKVPVDELAAAARQLGYNTGQFAVRHPTEPANAVLAYDARCTHMGCTVGWKADLGVNGSQPSYTGDEPFGRMLCPCHQSQFDPVDMGQNIAGGGPAPVPLRVVRIGIDNGVIVGLQRLEQSAPHGADQQGRGAAFRLANP